MICLSTYAQDEFTPVNAGTDNAPMRLVSSSSSRFINQKILRSYNAVYEHKGSTLAADSGDLYKDDIGNEFFEAHGNIVITQPSGTVIQGTHLHYDASSQHAVLTKNVKMVDDQSTLTTNYLTYNLRSQQGTYTGGGRIVGQGDTITSQRAYYFENTKDAYFNNKVVVRNESTIIYTDSMQYNTMYRDAFFFGPTTINGRKGEKLYTEKGTYNTAFGVAKFNKNNLYTEGSRFLKGDSLFYDRNTGLGEAFRNVLFVDTLDKFYASGEYGKYLESDQSILMTNKPLIKYVVRTDSTDNSQDSVQVDTVNRENLSRRELRRLEKAEEKEREKLEEAEKEKQAELKNAAIKPVETDSIAPPPVRQNSKIDTAYMTADTLFSKVIFVRDYRPLDLKLDRNGGQLEDTTEVDYGDIDQVDLFETGDSSVVEEVGAKELTQVGPARKEAATLKPAVKKAAGRPAAKPKPVDSATIQATTKADSVLRRNAVMPTGQEQDSLMRKALQSAQTADTLLKDSTEIYADTARTRIVKAYYNVRVFKSDLQAVADSVYYGMVDSMFRFMGSPMIWSEGSQINADTIFMQIKNNKMDNALLKDNAFMVNAVLDTLKFNQLKGRKITAFFANNNIDRLFVDGNAENLVFSTNDKTNTITEMFHDRSSRIKVKMEGKKVIDYVSIRKVDQKVYPFKLVTQEIEVLPGFLWKPEDRPKSVEDMLNRKRTKAAPVADQMGNRGENGSTKGQSTTDPEEKVEGTETIAPESNPNKKPLAPTKETKPAEKPQSKPTAVPDSTLKSKPDSTLKVLPDSTLKSKPDTIKTK
ncbi:OstA-like protein [Sphingobacterium mizutaii]|uniref:OstA-like protein n=1 Tax=Sphingobacterium mizutaii TaxID=1010 RepID=UPI003D99C04C